VVKMESDIKLLEKAKKVIKDYDIINLNTLKLKLSKGMVTCYWLIEDLKEIGAIEEFDKEKGLYKVLI
jgi:hypothetical protein